MNTETIKSDWTDMKSKIKARFGKLTDETIESLKGNLEPLSGKLQSAYGYAKEQADKEIVGFKSSLSSSPATEKVASGDKASDPSARLTN